MKKENKGLRYPNPIIEYGKIRYLHASPLLDKRKREHCAGFLKPELNMKRVKVLFRMTPRVGGYFAYIVQFLDIDCPTIRVLSYELYNPIEEMLGKCL